LEGAVRTMSNLSHLEQIVRRSIKIVPFLESGVKEKKVRLNEVSRSDDTETKNTISHRIGVIGALPQEVVEIEKKMESFKEVKHGVATFTIGKWAGKDIVLARSGVGMVYAGSVATVMIEVYGATSIIFTGVAGGIKEGLKIGDIVVAKDLINYEMNCKDFFLAHDPTYRHKLGEFPFMNGLRELTCDANLVKLAMEAPLKSTKFRRMQGRVVTGSEFHSTKRKKELEKLWKELGDPEAVEMEGAAVAQVALAYKIPFLVLRSISDNLEGDASEDFNAFATEVAEYLIPIVEYIIKKLK